MSVGDIESLQLVRTITKARRSEIREWCEVFTPDTMPRYEKQAILEIKKLAEVSIWTMIVVGEWDASVAFSVGDLQLANQCMFPTRGRVTSKTEITFNW